MTVNIAWESSGSIRSAVIIVTAILVGSSSIAAEQSGTPRKYATVLEIGDLSRLVSSVADIECGVLPHSNQRLCSSAARHTIWVFTFSPHPAHPAVIERQMTCVNGSLGIVRRGMYAGSRAQFDSWDREFAVLDRRQTDTWRAQFAMPRQGCGS